MECCEAQMLRSLAEAYVLIFQLIKPFLGYQAICYVAIASTSYNDSTRLVHYWLTLKEHV